MPGPRPLQRALHRGHRHVEHHRHLGRRDLQHLAQQEDGTLTGGQFLQPGDQRQPDAVPVAATTAGSCESGVTSSSGTAAARQRPVPPPDGRPGRPRARPAGRQRPPTALLGRGQAGVGGDAVEPDPQRRPAFEPAVRPPGPQVGLLHGVLRVVERAEHPVAVRQQFAPERLGLPDEPVEPGGHVLGHPRLLLPGDRRPHPYRPAPAAEGIGRSRDSSGPDSFLGPTWSISGTTDEGDPR